MVQTLIGALKVLYIISGEDCAVRHDLPYLVHTCSSVCIKVRSINADAKSLTYACICNDTPCSVLYCTVLFVIVPDKEPQLPTHQSDGGGRLGKHPLLECMMASQFIPFYRTTLLSVAGDGCDIDLSDKAPDIDTLARSSQSHPLGNI